MRLNFRMKLILFFSVIIIVSNLFIGVFHLYETRVILRDDIEMFSSKNLRSVNLNLDRYFRQYEQIFFSIAASPEMLNWLLAERGDKAKTSLNHVRLSDNYINPLRSFYPEIISINLLNKNGNATTFFLRSNMSLAHGPELDNEAWILETPLNNRTRITSGLNGAYLSYDKPLAALHTLRMARQFNLRPGASGYISIDVDMNPVTEILGEMKYTDSGEGMLLDETGRIMAHSDLDGMAKPFPMPEHLEHILLHESGYIHDATTDKIIAYSTLEQNGWKSVSVVPIDALSAGTARIGTVTLLVTGIGIAMAVLLVVVLSSSLTRRLNKLVVSMRHTRTGDFDKRVRISGDDEISLLAASYNQMLDHLEQNISDLAETKVLQQEAVLSALQAQINAHFLYNTLEFINAMAYMAGHQEIRRAVVSLSKMLRYTSNYKDTLVTVADEVAHLRHYLEIMKLQMGERLQFSIFMAEEAADIRCLKAVIQPIVENGIKHGIEPMEGTGRIDISIACDTKYATVCVQDNGCGFSNEKLMEIQTRFDTLSKESHIRDIIRVGLVNVNYRLQVFYGEKEETGLFISNREGARGARVSLRFPVRRKETL